MLRQIIKPVTEHYDLHIPKEYLNQEIEILPINNTEIQSLKINDDLKAFSNHSANTIEDK